MTRHLTDAYETQAGHRCTTWRVDGDVGISCSHRFVILPGDRDTAKLRADRVFDDAPLQPSRSTGSELPARGTPRETRRRRGGQRRSGTDVARSQRTNLSSTTERCAQ